jgi:hypothetical protein
MEKVLTPESLLANFVPQLSSNYATNKRLYEN